MGVLSDSHWVLMRYVVLLGIEKATRLGLS